jgi:hypothetical protein
MGKVTQQNRNKTTFVRCPKDEQHPFVRVPATICSLNGYQSAIMLQIISNKDGWNIVKYEISKRLGFPREKFDTAWQSLIDLGYIKVDRIQSGYDYTIYEDLSVTTTTGGICEHSTTTAGTTCAGGMLTTINNNYYKEMTTTEDSTCYDDQFNELLELYPNISNRSDGTTYSLKGKRKECKKAYINYLKSNAMPHDAVMLALRVELNEKERTGKMSYQTGLMRWIENKTFEQYKGKTIKPDVVQFGSELI